MPRSAQATAGRMGPPSQQSGVHDKKNFVLLKQRVQQKKVVPFLLNGFSSLLIDRNLYANKSVPNLRDSLLYCLRRLETQYAEYHGFSTRIDTPIHHGSSTQIPTSKHHGPQIANSIYDAKEQLLIQQLVEKKATTSQLQDVLFRAHTRARKSCKPGYFKEEIQAQVGCWMTEISASDKASQLLNAGLDEACNTLCEMHLQFPFFISLVSDKSFNKRLTSNGVQVIWLCPDSSFEDTPLSELTREDGEEEDVCNRENAGVDCKESEGDRMMGQEHEVPVSSLKEPPVDQADSCQTGEATNSMIMISLNGGSELRIRHTKKYLFTNIQTKMSDKSFEQFQVMIKYIANRYSLLFIGCSDDEDESQIAYNVNAIGETPHPHFAFIPHSKNPEIHSPRIKVIRNVCVNPSYVHSPMDTISDFLLLLSRSFSDEDYRSFLDIKDSSVQHSTFFRPDQRHDYLELQTKLEQLASQIQIATADLTNVIGSEKYFKDTILADLVSRYSDMKCFCEWIYPNGFDSAEYANQIVNKMIARSMAMEKNIKSGKDVQIMFIEENMRKALKERLEIEVERYRRLLELMLQFPNLDVRMIPSTLFSDNYGACNRTEEKEKLSFGLAKFGENIASFYAKTARGSGRIFHKHLVSMNTNDCSQKVKLFAKYWDKCTIKRKKTFSRVNNSLPEELRLPEDLANIVGDRPVPEKECLLFAKLQQLKCQLMLQGRGSKYETIGMNTTLENSSSNATPLSLPVSDSNSVTRSGFASKLEYAMLKTKESAKIVFIKHISVSIENDEIHNNTLINSFQKECEFAKKCRDNDLYNANLVKIDDAFIENLEMCLVYEYIRGKNLSELVHEVNKKYEQDNEEPLLTMETKLFIALNIARGLRFMHEEMNMAHRDIKPANIMVGLSEPDAEITCVKIVDLGGAKDECDDNTLTLNGKTLGTTRYRTPPSIGATYFTDDMYSLSMTLWELFAEEKPFHAELFQSGSNRPDINKLGEDCPSQVADVIVSCWQTEARGRPTIKKVYKALKTAYREFCGDSASAKKRKRAE